MSPRTVFLGRLIGLYCILIALSMLAHKQATVEMATAWLRQPELLFLSGVIVVAARLALILGHNIWSGGVLPVVVTLVGWVALLKGLLILFLSPDTASGFFLATLHYEDYFYFYAAFSLLLGIYLAYASMKGDAR